MSSARTIFAILADVVDRTHLCWFVRDSLSNALAGISPAQKQRDRVADSAFFWPSQLHFGRFGVFTEIALNHPNIVVI
jgi:hypothetical protein